MLRNNYIPRVSIISGIVKRGDAISETIIADLEAIDRLSAERRLNFDVKIYCRESDLPDTRVHVVNNWNEIVASQHFRTSDFYYFHFGIFNEVHYAMHHTRRNAGMAVYFHNVTQAQFCPPDAENLIHQSYRQIENFLNADEILAASTFSARQLESYKLGLKVGVVPLFGPNATSAASQPKTVPAKNEPIKLMYCGRFAPSKGVDQLLEALTIAGRHSPRPIAITLAGNAQFSDPAYIAKLESYAENMPEHINVSFAFNQGSESLQQLFRSSDAFILPSRHEGFGMPVAEALLAGTPVICSNAGSLPEVSNGFGLTFPAGDIQALADVLDRFCQAFAEGEILCDRGTISMEHWHRSVTDYASTYAREAYVDRIKSRFDGWLQPKPGWRDSARQNLEALSSSHDQSEAINRYDCAVTGSLVADRFLRAIDQRHVALARLLKLAFDSHQSDSDIDYWAREWAKYDTSDFLNYLSNIMEVRNSPVRLQSSVFAKSTVSLAGVDEKKPVAGPEPERRGNEIELRLLMQDTQQSAFDFVCTAYRMVLHREADASGIAHYLEQLRSRGDHNRSWLIEDLMKSDEAKAVMART